MCKQAIKLQLYINNQLEQEIALKLTTYKNSALTSNNNIEADQKDLKKLQLTAPKQQHLKAVTQMLKRFKTATSFLSKNLSPQILYIQLMYNQLFNFLDQITEELGKESNSVEGTAQLDAVKAAAQKG